MIRHIIASLSATLVVSAAVLSPSMAAPSWAAVSLTGAGSTFDQPLFTKAFSVYSSSHDVSINYQGIGSGAGIQQFTAKTVDFGASDVPMAPSELAAAEKAGGAVEQIPITLGGVSIAYNVPAVKTGLHLTGPVIADIFLGLIKTWNDKQIRALNPKVKLPSLQITVVHRSDGSGTSYAFTDYLSTISATWRGQVGTNKLPNWPVGVGGKGTAGVAGLVQQTPGSIGYVELSYVLQNKMKQAMVQNRSKQFVSPTIVSVAADAAAFPKVNAHDFSIVNGKGAKAYPISTYSWVLVFRNQPDKTKGKALADLMKWMVTTGQKYSKGLAYVPLPKKIQAVGVAQTKRIH